MQVAIIGKGKMGTLLTTTAQKKGMEVVGNFDTSNADELQAQNVDFVIDFSHRDNLEWVLEYVQAHHVSLVYGTTALTSEDFGLIKEASKNVPIFYSANYSIGIAILKKIVAQVTPLLEDDFDMEIVEKHHNQKKDAPSGTALSLLSAMDPEDRYKHVFGREGVIGARQKEIGVHAIRGGSLAGEHTVYYLGNDEVLTLTHEAISRQIFVNGALKAAQYLVGKPAGFYTMDDLLGG